MEGGAGVDGVPAADLVGGDGEDRGHGAERVPRDDAVEEALAIDVGEGLGGDDDEGLAGGGVVDVGRRRGGDEDHRAGAEGLVAADAVEALQRVAGDAAALGDVLEGLAPADGVAVELAVAVDELAERLGGLGGGADGDAHRPGGVGLAAGEDGRGAAGEHLRVELFELVDRGARGEGEGAE